MHIPSKYIQSWNSISLNNLLVQLLYLTIQIVCSERKSLKTKTYNDFRQNLIYVVTRKQ